MERTSQILVAGQPIIFLNFANFTEPATALKAIEHARQFIAKYPPRSVKTLTDVTGSRANNEIIEALKGLTKANKPYVKAGAVVGLTALQRVIYSAVMAFSGRNLSAFATLDEAKAWLVKQA